MYVLSHVSAQCFRSYVLMWETNTCGNLSKAVIGGTATLKVLVLPCPCLFQELLITCLPHHQEWDTGRARNLPSTRRAQPSEQLRHAGSPWLSWLLLVILAPPGSSWLSWLLLVILVILAPPGYPGHPCFCWLSWLLLVIFLVILAPPGYPGSSLLCPSSWLSELTWLLLVTLAPPGYLVSPLLSCPCLHQELLITLLTWHRERDTGMAARYRRHHE
jgi:hypothetical protein